MIEIIQQTEKTEENLEGRLPKNIRQIGNPEKDFRIYMEDYVYTYLHPAQIPGMEEGIYPRLLILLGEINHFSNRSCAFICGAIQVEEDGFSGELPELNDTTWRRIHKEIQQFFDKCEIVGWVLDIPGNTLEITQEMEQVHRRNFVSPYQFFFLMDAKEREEAFFVWKEGRLTRKEGYFIYYEKNPAMQEYMISRREAAYGEISPTETVKDTAARNYRAMMMEKQEQIPYKSRTGFLSGLTSALMIVALCSVSVVLLANIRRMENMEQTISVMSVAIESTEQAKANEDNQVAIETISGNIFPAEDEKEEEGKEVEDPAAEDANVTENQNADAASDDGQAQEVMAQPAEAEDLEEAQQETEATPDVMPPEEEPPEPAEEETAEPPAMTEAEMYRAQGFYVVQAGDSLRQICYKVYQTYTMMDALCGANDIQDQDFIYVGQKLVLP